MWTVPSPASRRPSHATRTSRWVVISSKLHPLLFVTIPEPSGSRTEAWPQIMSECPAAANARFAATAISSGESTWVTR